MPAILKHEISAMCAAMFVDNLLNSDSNIYLAIARDNSIPWDNENVPPTPIDNLVDEKGFRENLIGIKRLIATNASLMVPRINWAPGMSFEPLSETASAPRKATNYYCITSNNYVYQCIGKSAEGILTFEGAEPDLRQEMTTADGYTWKFLFDVTTKQVTDGNLLDYWLPVPYNKHGVYPGGTLTENQHSYGDIDANYTLGAFRVLLNITLADEAPDITFDHEYRQIGILYDPKDNEGNLIAGDTYAKDEFNFNSGKLFFLENRRVVTRTEGQSEQLLLLLSF